MNEKIKKMGSRGYITYIFAAFVVGAGLFFYEMHVNSEPLLTVSSVSQENRMIQPLLLTVVRTGVDEERGLGGRPSLPADEGMLFVFATAGRQGIWMKDMQFPIDIISLDANFSVTHIEPSIASSTYPTVFYSPVTTKYIIEANAGYAQKNNLKVGDVLDFARKAVNK